MSRRTIGVLKYLRHHPLRVNNTLMIYPRVTPRQHSLGPQHKLPTLSETARKDWNLRGLRFDLSSNGVWSTVYDPWHAVGAKPLSTKRIAYQIRKRKFDAEIKYHSQTDQLTKDVKNMKAAVQEQIQKIMERDRIVTIPNLLCVTRLGLTLPLGYLIVTGDFTTAVGVFTIAGITDLLDGWIARNFESQMSMLGSFLDPLADKVLVGTAFVTLTYVGLVPVPLTLLIVARDIALIASGFYIRFQSLPPPRTLYRYLNASLATAQLAPTTISKINTAIQLLLVACSLTAPVVGMETHPVLHGLWWLTAGTTIASGLSYIFTKGTYRYLAKRT